MYICRTDLVTLDLNPERSVSQAYFVAHGRAKHSDVRITANIRILRDFQRTRLGNVPEALLDEVADDGLRARQVDDAAGETVPTGDYSCTGNGAQRHRFRVPRLEPNSSSRRDVETLAICLCAIEHQGGVGLNEMIVGADLDHEK